MEVSKKVTDTLAALLKESEIAAKEYTKAISKEVNSGSITLPDIQRKKKTQKVHERYNQQMLKQSSKSRLRSNQTLSPA